MNKEIFLIIHSFDETTAFLSSFQDEFPDNYISIESNDESITTALGILERTKKDSLIIFLGHGDSKGFYSPESIDFEKRYILDTSNVGSYLEDKNAVFISCRSSEFITKIKSVKNVVGFGNILSSMNEVNIEYDQTGYERDLKNTDINYFNSCYVNAIIKTIKLYLDSRISIEELSNYIEFYINKNILNTLKKKNKENRVEVARLLFEFRNDMLYIQK